MKQRCFYACPLSEKLLYTAFLLTIGTGYLMALTQADAGFAMRT